MNATPGVSLALGELSSAGYATNLALSADQTSPASRVGDPKLHRHWHAGDTESTQLTTHGDSPGTLLHSSRSTNHPHGCRDPKSAKQSKNPRNCSNCRNFTCNFSDHHHSGSSAAINRFIPVKTTKNSVRSGLVATTCRITPQICCSLQTFFKVTQAPEPPLSSKINVTGPSFTNSTCIIAPNRPVATRGKYNPI